MPSPTLYFVRHGETDWNAVGRYQGQTDIPLNDKGRGQAARNGRALRDLLGARAHTVDYVTSPLARARETMEIARREIGIPVPGYRSDEQLKEQHYGHWEGQLWSELPGTDPVGYAARLADKWGWRPRGGESYAMLSQRIASWLAGMESDAVVVSHGAVSRVLRGLMLTIPPDDIPQLEVPQDKVMVLRAGTIEWV